MPYVSKAQAAKFHADPRLRKFAAEFDAATPDISALPERITPHTTGFFHPKHQAKAVSHAPQRGRRS